MAAEKNDVEPLGVPTQTAFDSQSNGDRWKLLAYVAYHLLTDEGTPAPPLTALSESAVKHVYAYLQENMIYGPEVFGEDLLATYKEACCDDEDEEDEAKDVDDYEEDEWNDMIEAVADLIFWDRDFEMGHLFPAQAIPVASGGAMRQEGDGVNYFGDTSVLGAARSMFYRPKDAREHIMRLYQRVRDELTPELAAEVDAKEAGRRQEREALRTIIPEIRRSWMT